MTIRSHTPRTLTKPEQARQVRLMGDIARRITRDFLIVFVAGITPKVVVLNRTTGREKRLDHVQAVAVSETALQWKIGLYALCRDEQGTEYIKGEAVLLGRPVRQRDIHQALSKRHMDFMRREVNRKHLLTLAWVATTGEEATEGWVDRAFTGLGAWKGLDIAEDLPGGGLGVTGLIVGDANA